MFYPKYKGYTIEFDLAPKYKDYSVECTYKYIKAKEKYLISMWLKHKEIDDKFKIDSQKVNALPISGTKETIVENICRVVEQAYITDFFDRYVERFEYTYKCFDKGNDIYEMENLKQKNDTKDGL